MSSSEERRARRRLLTLQRKGKLTEKYLGTTYSDNKGNEFQYKWMAKLSSFWNMFKGCLKNGFPVVVPKLWYNAWAFYPFFFIRRDLQVKDPVVTLNHERIHIRQQLDIHLTISLPLIILSGIAEWFGVFNPIYLLCIVPFIPTLVYGIEVIRTWRNMILSDEHRKMSFSDIRENTCFEREAISRSTNADYLFTRKFWAVLAYTGWKKFQNYGLK